MASLLISAECQQAVAAGEIVLWDGGGTIKTTLNLAYLATRKK